MNYVVEWWLDGETGTVEVMAVSEEMAIIHVRNMVGHLAHIKILFSEEI